MAIGAITSTLAPSIVLSNSNDEELFKINGDGEIFYKHREGELKKVECSSDIVEAFSETVFHMTGQEPEDVMIEKYIQKILNHERSEVYITKLEKTFRKLKLEKLKNSKL